MKGNVLMSGFNANVNYKKLLLKRVKELNDEFGLTGKCSLKYGNPYGAFGGHGQVYVPNCNGGINQVTFGKSSQEILRDLNDNVYRGNLERRLKSFCK